MLAQYGWLPSLLIDAQDQKRAGTPELQATLIPVFCTWMLGDPSMLFSL